jgi:hypothetical protein
MVWLMRGLSDLYIAPFSAPYLDDDSPGPLNSPVDSHIDPGIPNLTISNATNVQSRRAFDAHLAEIERCPDAVEGMRAAGLVSDQNSNLVQPH